MQIFSPVTGNNLKGASLFPIASLLAFYFSTEQKTKGQLGWYQSNSWDSWETRVLPAEQEPLLWPREPCSVVPGTQAPRSQSAGHATVGRSLFPLVSWCPPTPMHAQRKSFYRALGKALTWAEHMDCSALADICVRWPGDTGMGHTHTAVPRCSQVHGKEGKQETAALRDSK